MLLMQAESITWASGRGLGPGLSTFWAPKVTRLSTQCLFTGPKKSRFPGPNPLVFSLVMDAARIKSIMRGAV